MLEKIEKPGLETVELRSDGKCGKFVLAPLNVATEPHLVIACGVCCSPRCPVSQSTP